MVLQNIRTNWQFVQKLCYTKICSKVRGTTNNKPCYLENHKNWNRVNRGLAVCNCFYHIMMSLIKVEKQETAPPIFHIIIFWENDIWIIGTWHRRQRPLLEKKQGEVFVLHVFRSFASWFLWWSLNFQKAWWSCRMWRICMEKNSICLARQPII